jgi:hypothetical protein
VKRILLVLTAAFVMVAMVVAMAMPAFADTYKVPICHKPGTPAEKTLYVPYQALSGHLGHGDYKGPCKKKY